MGAILAWLASDQGIKLIGMAAAAIYGAIKGGGAVKDARARKLTEAEALALEVFDSVESLHRAGKLDAIIAGLGGDKSAAKYTRAMTMFAEGWRARHRGRNPDVFAFDAMRQVIERRAARGSVAK